MYTAIHSPNFTLYPAIYNISCNIPCTLQYTLHTTLHYTTHCALQYTLCATIHSVHCNTSYTLQYTLHTTHITLIHSQTAIHSVHTHTVHCNTLYRSHCNVMHLRGALFTINDVQQFGNFGYETFYTGFEEK